MTERLESDQPPAEKIKEIYSTIQTALEENPRLYIDTREDTTSARTRTFRRTLISGIEASMVLEDEFDDYERIGIESRIAHEDPEDALWVRVELHANGAASDASKNKEYMLDYNFGRFRGWSITKRLPLLDPGDPLRGSTDDMDEQVAELAATVEGAARTITPEDIAFLERLAQSVAE